MDNVDFVGNRTECALLMMLRKWEVRRRSAVHLHVSLRRSAPLLCLFMLRGGQSGGKVPVQSSTAVKASRR